MIRIDVVELAAHIDERSSNFEKAHNVECASEKERSRAERSDISEPLNKRRTIVQQVWGFSLGKQKEPICGPFSYVIATSHFLIISENCSVNGGTGMRRETSLY
jgi:hypothetical protein